MVPRSIADILYVVRHTLCDEILYVECVLLARHLEEVVDGARPVWHCGQVRIVSPLVVDDEFVLVHAFGKVNDGRKLLVAASHVTV
jgi:hypothetical protein